MTYARARLWLGISGVGLMVVLASAALFFAWPQQIFGGWAEESAIDAKGFLWIVTLYMALHVPLDYLGGYWLPCHFSRQCLRFEYFASQYLRGVLVQGAFFLLTGMGLLQVGRWGGRPAVMALLAVMMLVMVEAQDWIARVVAGLSESSQEIVDGHRVLIFSGMDAGFAGGLSGLPGRERIVLPSLWQRILPKAGLAMELDRRFGAMRSGSRLRGLALAMAWNLGGFYLATLLPGADVVAVAGLFTAALGFTLWSFIGLLLLPTLSRWGVFEVDQFTRKQGLQEADFAATVRELDQLQDDEPARPVGVESIFHPVPSVEARLQEFRNGKGKRGAWNAARYALYLSWPCLGFLSRAVHCNSGRPELWVMLPVD